MDSRLELIQQLCVQAGMIMEDASVEAISTLTDDQHVRRATLSALRSAASDICMLIAAAEVLDRRLEA